MMFTSFSLPRLSLVTFLFCFCFVFVCFFVCFSFGDVAMLHAANTVAAVVCL